MTTKFAAMLILSFFALTTAKADVPKNWSEPTEPFHIAGPIYYAGTNGLGVYVIKSNGGLILLNGAMPQSISTIVDSVRKLGFDPKDIRLLLISHAHIDHVGTVAAIKKLTKAPIAVMEAEAALLQSGGKSDYLYAARPEMHFEGVTADKILKDGEAVTLGDVELTAHWTPGHTRGCITWEMNIEEAGKKYKVVFADGTGINPGTRFGTNASYPGIASDYKRTFSVLESLHPDIFLSYHAEFFDLAGKRQRMKKEGIKAWVDPEGYKQQIAAKKSEFEKLMLEETPKY